LSPKGCTGPAFYAVIIPAVAVGHRRSFRSQQKQQQNDDHGGGRPGGVKAIPTSVPMKHPFFAGVKSVDYLPNALAAVEAEERGARAAVWVDEGGCVVEGPTMNVAFVTAAGDLMVPTFDRVLGGCTARRVLALAPRLVEAGLIRSVGNARIPVGEARRSAEMMLLGSGLPVLPVVEWVGIRSGMVNFAAQDYSTSTTPAAREHEAETREEEEARDGDEPDATPPLQPRIQGVVGHHGWE
jgi:4-amino-4-deoxychorismate lyase